MSGGRLWDRIGLVVRIKVCFRYVWDFISYLRYVCLEIGREVRVRGIYLDIRSMWWYFWVMSMNGIIKERKNSDGLWIK